MFNFRIYSSKFFVLGGFLALSVCFQGAARARAQAAAPPAQGTAPPAQAAAPPAQADVPPAAPAEPPAPAVVPAQAHSPASPEVQAAEPDAAAGQAKRVGLGQAGEQAAGQRESQSSELEQDIDLGHFDLSEALATGETSMSAEQAAERAVAHSPSVASSKAALRKAKEGASQAWLAVYPRLELTARYTRLSEVEMGGLGGLRPEDDALLQGLVDAQPALSPGRLFDDAVLEGLRAEFSFPQYLNQYALRAELSYPLSDLFFSILPGYRALKGFSEAEALRVKAEQQKVALQAREAFYNYARARASLVVAQAGLAQAQAHRKDVQAMVEAGAVAQVELMRVDAQVASSRVAVARAKGGVAMARVGLGALVGAELPVRIAIAEDLSTPSPPLTGSSQQLLQQALEKRPEILALHAVIEANDESISAKSGGRLPHLALAAGADYANPNQRVFPQEDEFNLTWDVSAVLKWSPNDLLDADRGVAQAEADLEKARAELAGLEDLLKVEVTQAYEAYGSAQAAMEAASVGIQAAEESFRVRREQFRAGAAVATEVIDAESELRRARLELVNAAIDLRIARAQLERAAGLTPIPGEPN